MGRAVLNVLIICNDLGSHTLTPSVPEVANREKSLANVKFLASPSWAFIVFKTYPFSSS